MKKEIMIGEDVFARKGHTYVMGILNVTPDSFSDGGRYDSVNEALKRARQMVLEGVDIIDIGGQSTRPGHVQISEEEEIERIVPVIEAIKKHMDIPISVDTYKANVAKAAIEAGADSVASRLTDVTTISSCVLPQAAEMSTIPQHSIAAAFLNFSVIFILYIH